MPATEQTDLTEDFSEMQIVVPSDKTSADSCEHEEYRSTPEPFTIPVASEARRSTPAPQPEWFESYATRKNHEKFIRDAVEIMIENALFKSTDRANRVLEWRDPAVMLKTFDLTLKSAPEAHGKLLELLKDTVQFSVKTGHPYFVNQLYSSVDPYGLVGQWLTDVLNPSVYTYEVSPIFTLMEEHVLKEMRTIVGFSGGQGDGIFCPGGSIANGYAISCARYRLFPDVKHKGLHGLPRLVVFTSEDAHYSIKKLGSFLGLGADNVYAVKTDAAGKMCVNSLIADIERALAEGATPFMVSATSGTTVLGAFDPLPEIAEVCVKYKLWMHVDAAWGGGALMSNKYKRLMRGIERADSVTWNPHKLLAAPQQCSTLLLRHENILSEVHSSNATYLFQKDKFYDTQYDTGDKHIQCGRRADVLKFWFMWKAKGSIGFEKHIDKVFNNAEFFTETIKRREGFEMVLEHPECTNISFWYVPPSLRGQKGSANYTEKLHKVAPKIKECMMKEGSMMVTYQPLRSYPNFFRLVMQNSGLKHSDMIHFVDEFERLGRDL